MKSEPYTHPSRCSGCPFCREEFAALMRADPAAWSEWLTDRTCSDPSMRGSQACRVVPGGRSNMRTQTIRPCTCEVCAPRARAAVGVAPPPPSMAAPIREHRATTHEQRREAVFERMKAEARARCEAIGR